eukprot:363793-Chlamydomonas_euryale.AAC.4
MGGGRTGCERVRVGRRGTTGCDRGKTGCWGESGGGRGEQGCGRWVGSGGVSGDAGEQIPREFGECDGSRWVELVWVGTPGSCKRDVGDG